MKAYQLGVHSFMVTPASQTERIRKWQELATYWLQVVNLPPMH
ncbi:hypothetical protein [Spirosoma sp. KNUC1025]